MDDQQAAIGSHMASRKNLVGRNMDARPSFAGDRPMQRNRTFVGSADIMAEKPFAEVVSVRAVVFFLMLAT